MRRKKQQMQYLLKVRSKMEDASTLLKKQKVRMSRYLDSSTEAQMVSMESVRSPSGRTIMGHAIRKSSV